MLPSYKKEDSSIKHQLDEKSQLMDDLSKSPQKKIEKIHTKLGDIRYTFHHIKF